MMPPHDRRLLSQDLLKKYNIPTAAYGRFTDVEEAKAYVREQGAPIVVKTDGLAAGKGVLLCDTVEEAEKAIDFMLVEEGFGAAGKPTHTHAHGHTHTHTRGHTVTITFTVTVTHGHTHARTHTNTHTRGHKH